MDIVATVRHIKNGYIVQYGGQEYFIKGFDIQAFLDTVVEPDHEAALMKLVLAYPPGSGKIPPIKAVREYCSKNKFDKYYGLRAAKDYVERIRDSEYWRGYPD
jgi:hypothetical protein